MLSVSLRSSEMLRKPTISSTYVIWVYISGSNANVTVFNGLIPTSIEHCGAGLHSRSKAFAENSSVTWCMWFQFSEVGNTNTRWHGNNVLNPKLAIRMVGHRTLSTQMVRKPRLSRH